MRRLEARADTVHFGFHDASLAPVFEVDSSEEFRHLMSMAVHEDLDNAARLAMRSMIRLLEGHYGMTFHDTYRLCSVAAGMHVTQFVNGNRGIHVMLPRSLISGLSMEPDLTTDI